MDRTVISNLAKLYLLVRAGIAQSI